MKEQFNHRGIKVRAGIAKGTENTAAIGIASKDHGLNQAGTHNGFCKNAGVFFRIGMIDTHFNEMRRAFTVGCHQHSQIVADTQQCFAEEGVAFILRNNGFVSGLPVGQQKQRVVCACIPVDGDHVEGVRHVGTERFYYQFL